jgi:hypothetical protein
MDKVQTRTGIAMVIDEVAAAATYFACVFGAGFILGMIRVPFLVPRLGVRTAELLEMPIMLIVVVLAAKRIVRGFHLARYFRSRILVGCIALGFVIAAELSFALLLGRQSAGDYIASRDPVSGSVYLALLALFALMPAIVERHGVKDSP